MNKAFRKYVLNTIGIIIFASIAVFTIIIARGHRIDFTNGQLVTTGTIRISSQPEDIQVFLNEQPQQLTEKRVEGIDPGEYSLRIQHADYASWEGPVSVKSGFITDVVVTLFPTEHNLQAVTQTNVDKVTFSKDRAHAVYAVTDSNVGSQIGIWKQTLSTSNLLPIVTNNENAQKITNLTPLIKFISEGTYHLFVSPNAEKLLVTNGDKNTAYLLDTNQYNEPAESRAVDLGYPMDQITFLDNSRILVRSNRLLVEYNLDTQVSEVIYYHPELAAIYTVTNDTITWLSSDHKQLFSRVGGTTQEVELENVSLPTGITGIKTSDNGNWIVLSQGYSITIIEKRDSYIKNFADARLVTHSPNMQFIVTEGASGTLQLIETKKSEVLAEISHKQVSLPLTLSDINNGNVSWAGNSSFFVFRKEDGDICAYDSSLQNFSTLITNQESRNTGNYLLTGDNSSLFVLLNDGNTEVSQKNLYQLAIGEE